MSNEADRDPAGVTAETVRLLMEANLERVDERFFAFLEMYRRDQEKANEFRSALDDLGKTMATRRELETAMVSIGGRIDQNQAQIAELRSRLDIGPAGLAQVQTYQQRQTGRDEGSRESRANVYALVGLLATLLGIVNVAAILLSR